MTDESGPDAKILAVPLSNLSSCYEHVHSMDDVPPLLIKQISHFFEHYKDLEENKWVKIDGWQPVDEAKKEIVDSIQRFKDAPVKPCF
jgi:inorganic pyrophosphatase